MRIIEPNIVTLTTLAVYIACIIVTMRINEKYRHKFMWSIFSISFICKGIGYYLLGSLLTLYGLVILWNDVKNIQDE